MKIKMLPNWCKKLGLVVFLIGSSISGFSGFMDGFMGEAYGTMKYALIEFKNIDYFELLSILGLIIYMVSKEKIEDDYINKLRLESYQLNSLLGLLLALGVYVFFGDLKFSLNYFVNLFLISYLIIFAFKKRIY